MSLIEHQSGSRKFAIFIPTFGRPNSILTLNRLRSKGYTGKVYIVCSDDDTHLSTYIDNFGDDVIVFNKIDSIRLFDVMTNNPSYGAAVFARNFIIEKAKECNLDYYCVADDDYKAFEFRQVDGPILRTRQVKNINSIIDAYIEFMESSGVDCVALAQGGDFIGGGIAYRPKVSRKVMNFFFFKGDFDMKFNGNINEDVNFYLGHGKTGAVMLTPPNAMLRQRHTQTAPGGMTPYYINNGTYAKTFFSFMYRPDCVRFGMMGNNNKRMHHIVSWRHATPMIISDIYKK